ncbi:mannose-1-phosphate guanylyltransferase [Anoxynatronum sibiricum]|uniref:Mannose-1-phosphate guanylyltransferase n=1 Tax=Anoxynatronum sibiricum TaxID=210623 RepID=A0ABU9VPS3_9CLOT
MKRYAVIMAGGHGERFWPESRVQRPKQFLTLVGARSLIQQSFDRIQDFMPPEQILVVLGQEHLALAKEQLPSLPAENFLVEPVGRNTAPCIGLAAVHIRKRDPGSVMLIFPADHLIQGQTDFQLCLKKGFEQATDSDYLVTIGIIPSRPETGYGYMEREETSIDQTTPLVYPVRRFVEKPDTEKAREYVQSGHYYWNSGIFIWKADLILDKMELHLPELYQGLLQIESHIDTSQEATIMESVFPNLPRISIDYGILEKSDRILMVQGDFGWDDLGSWESLAEHSKADEMGLVIHGDYVGIDNTNCLIQGQAGLIAALGVHDLVIVQAGDVILVCDKNRTQEVKDLVSLAKEKYQETYL